jgi:hypothetical protein
LILRLKQSRNNQLAEINETQNMNHEQPFPRLQINDVILSSDLALVGRFDLLNIVRTDRPDHCIIRALKLLALAHVFHVLFAPVDELPAPINLSDRNPRITSVQSNLKRKKPSPQRKHFGTNLWTPPGNNHLFHYYLHGTCFDPATR